MEKRLVHDYPRLAKESGFNFCFRFKRINWAKISDLDIEEIAFKKKYEQLEEGIDLILNCELDEEVTQILDKNFVKLFRLAQLSVGYLRHCLSYLDQCVVLLQEKLSTALKQADGVNILKTDKQNGIECDKCQKIFLSASYLASHQRRRHSTPEKVNAKSVSTQTEIIRKVTATAEQQTESKRTFNASTQTSSIKLFERGVMTDAVQENISHTEYNEKLETVLERLEAIEAKSEKVCTADESGKNDNAQILQYLQNIMPLLIAVPKEKEDHGITVTAIEDEEKQPLLIDLTSPSKPQQVVHSADTNQTVIEEVQMLQEKPDTILRARRKKIVSPPEVSDEEIKAPPQPVAKPRRQTFPPKEAFVEDMIKIQDPNKILSPKRKNFHFDSNSSIKSVEPVTSRQILARKLRELGIDPEWTRLPTESYEKIMSILQHQNTSTEYTRLRQKLESRLSLMIKGEEIFPQPLPKIQQMYDMDSESDSPDIPSPVSVADEIPKTDTSVAALKMADLSVYHIPEKERNENSDSDESEPEPTQVKSSLLIKNKDEPKKRVVFADNFILETTHDQLLDFENASSSSSNSWDIPTLE